MPVTTEEYAREYLRDTPELLVIAKCESKLRQFNKDGSVLRGEINPQDIGFLQINEHYHLETSKKLGFDIYTLEGNLGYGKYLYLKEGSKPWSWSSRCWKGP